MMCGIFRVLDSLVECSQCGNDVEVSVLAVECVDCLLVSMAQLCQESASGIIQPDILDLFNSRFSTLKSADSESTLTVIYSDKFTLT